MVLDVLKYDVVRDVAAGRTKVTARPEVTPPVAFLERGKLALNFV